MLSGGVVDLCEVEDYGRFLDFWEASHWMRLWTTGLLSLCFLVREQPIPTGDQSTETNWSWSGIPRALGQSKQSLCTLSQRFCYSNIRLTNTELIRIMKTTEIKLVFMSLANPTSVIWCLAEGETSFGKLRRQIKLLCTRGACVGLAKTQSAGV